MLTATINRPGYSIENTGGTFEADIGTLQLGGGVANPINLNGSGTSTFNAVNAGSVVQFDCNDLYAGPVAGSGAGHLVFNAGNTDTASGAPSTVQLAFAAGYAQITGADMRNVVNTGDLTYTGSADRVTLVGTATFTNRGTIEVAGTGNLLGSGAGSQFVNDTTGVVNFQSDAGFGNAAGSNETLVNNGLIEKTGGTGTTTIGFGSFGTTSQGGTFNVATGSISFPYPVDATAGINLVTAAGTAIVVTSTLTAPSAAPLTSTGPGVVRFDGRGVLQSVGSGSGTLAFAPGTLQFAGDSGLSGTFVNTGDLIATSNGAGLSAALLTNRGTIELTDTTAQYLMSNVTFDAAGTITIPAGVKLNYTGDMTNPGTLVVGGSLTVQGTLTLAPTSALRFVVAGPAGGAGSPLLTAGNVTLAGSLAAATAGGYVPSTGATYTAATFQSATGVFASTAGTDPDFLPTVTGTAIVLTSTDTANPNPTPTPTPTSSLTVSVKKNTVPAAAVAGAKAGGAVAAVITNGGASTTKGKVTAKLYASTTGVVDAAAATLATAKTASLTLKPTRSATVTLPIKSLPTAAGTYTLLLQVTDPTGGTSAAVAVGQVTVAAARVDLTATVTAVRPATPKAGQPLSLTVTVTNAGNVSSSGTASISVYLSSDGTALTVPIQTLAKRGLTVKPGSRSVSIRLQVRLPAAAPAGSYYPLVTLSLNGKTATGVDQTRVTVS